MSHFVKPWKEHLKTTTRVIKAKINFGKMFTVIRSCILALKCFLNCTWRVQEMRSMSSAKSVEKKMISECFAILWKSVSHLVKQHAKCAIWEILTSQIGFKGNNGIANVLFIFLYLWHIMLQICFTFFHVHCDPFHQPCVLSLCRCFGSTPWLLITCKL